MIHGGEGFAGAPREDETLVPDDAEAKGVRNRSKNADAPTRQISTGLRYATKFVFWNNIKEALSHGTRITHAAQQKCLANNCGENILATLTSRVQARRKALTNNDSSRSDASGETTARPTSTVLISTTTEAAACTIKK